MVATDDVFSRSAEIQELVKQALKIEDQKLDTKAKDAVARAMIARFQQEENEE